MNRYFFIYSFIIALISFCLAANAQSANQISWKLQWSDEFNGYGLPDSNYWSYDVGGHGWGNNELQYYTKADTGNTKIQDGCLWLTAKHEDKAGKAYTSARLVSKHKADFKYGRIEVRALLPKGIGLWPAIWMLPTDWKYGGWPKSGEIDIMEHVGYMPDSVFGSVHTNKFNHVIGTQKTKGIAVTNLYADFHVYAIEWTTQQIDFYLDNKRYYSFRNSGNGSDEWPFDQPFHVLLNIAVGGNWGGQKGVDNRSFPATMKVDYVRYYTAK